MPTSTRPLEHYRAQQTVAVAAVLAARAAVQRQDRRSNRPLATLTALLARYQLVSATQASRTLAAEAGRAPVANPAAFVGETGLGFPLQQPLATILDQLTADMQRRADVISKQMFLRLDTFVHSEVIEAGRGAASIEIVSEPDWTNYVRVLNPPSCFRCVPLAGRIYRDLDGFFRHPLCDCQHWPVSSWEQAHDEGLLFSGLEAFEKGQIRGLSQADEQAIRDGADINQVVNATSGMFTAEIFGRYVKATTTGTTKRATWRRSHPNQPVRLRPEAIYAAAKDRDDAIRLLGLYGYLAA